MGSWEILQGDCRDVLELVVPDKSVQCCVTSPPYYGLRDYGVAGQLGLEPTPEEYIEAMVDVFRQVRRVLKDDGTLWINIGDTYAGQGGQGVMSGKEFEARARGRQSICRSSRVRPAGGIKTKDLIGIPWMLAFALRADGWYLRQDIIWHKPNPMPESVRDRCTKAHEYIFLLSKSERYYYDAEAIKEPASENTHARLPGNKKHKGTDAFNAGDEHHRTKAGLVAYAEKMRRKYDPGTGNKNNPSFDAAMAVMPEKRNKRSVWTVTTKPFKGAHFATFPPALIEPCILAGSRPGDTVLDPFGGAGTTALVASNLGRKSMLCELNSQYIAIAKERLAA